MASSTFQFSGKLYLIPTTLGESKISEVLPESIKSIIKKIDNYIVENEKLQEDLLNMYFQRKNSLH